MKKPKEKKSKYQIQFEKLLSQYKTEEMELVLKICFELGRNLELEKVIKRFKIKGQ